MFTPMKKMGNDELVEPTQVTVGWILQALDGRVPQWDVLRKASKIKQFETHTISGAGFLSNVLRLRVLFENGEHFPLILKAPTTEKLNKCMISENGAEAVPEVSFEYFDKDPIAELIVSYHNQEIDFYENVGNQYKGFPLAKLYGYKRSTMDPVKHGQILLEDISYLGMLADNRAGLNLQQCESVIENIAKFHVYTLSLPNINEILKLMPNTMDEFEESAFSFVTRLAKADPLFADNKDLLKKYLDDNKDQIGDAHVKFDITPLLSHGDLWGNNIFFERNADGTCGNKVATFLDWQCCYPGTGVEDVVRFICTSASLEVLTKHEHSLLQLYFERINQGLKSHGLPPRFTFDKMMEIYKFHRLHEYIFSIFILLPLIEQQTPFGETALGRLRHNFEKVLADIKQNE